MTLTLAFDVYGTLINTHGLVPLLHNSLGDIATEFSLVWREKQLEYAFRKALMKRYEPFTVCTQQALEYTCARFKVSLTAEQKQTLLEGYKILPAFDDVKAGLEQLTAAGHRLYAFSNGDKKTVDILLDHAGIKTFFLDLISVNEVHSFKPDPMVYDYFLQKTGATNSEAWLISSNPFDIIGASAVGMNSAWIQRSLETVFDPWDIQPSLIVNNLVALSNKFNERKSI